MCFIPTIISAQFLVLFQKETKRIGLILFHQQLNFSEHICLRLWALSCSFKALKGAEDLATSSNHITQTFFPNKNLRAFSK